MSTVLPRFESSAPCPTLKIGFCGDLPAAEVEVVAAMKQASRVHQAGSELYRQGEMPSNLFLIVSGWVMQYASFDGGEQHIIDFALPGDLVGFTQRLPRPMPHTAQCLTASRICALPADKFRAHMAHSLRFTERVLDMALEREARAVDHAANIGSRSAHDRVAHFMAGLFMRVHRRPPRHRGDSAMLPLTLVHIGLALGLTHVHVSRTLRTLREQGILQFNRSRLEILDPVALGRIVGFEAHLPADPEFPTPITNGMPSG
jgi:CRP-like cAMP-binding protein